MVARARDQGRRGQLKGVTSSFGANVTVALIGLATGPILARALGPSGRGELAVIVLVLTLAPVLGDSGVGAWISRRRALGDAREHLLATAAVVMTPLVLLGMAAAAPLSRLLGQGRPVVEHWLLLLLLLLPLLSAAQLLVAYAWAEGRWTQYALAKALAGVLPAGAYVVLVVTSSLTVNTAAAAVVGGALLANAPMLFGLRLRALVTTRRQVAAAGRFGAANWLGSVALLGTLRADQIFLSVGASSAQLGFYAVATTLSGVPLILAASTSPMIAPSVARGDLRAFAFLSRITIGGVVVLSFVTAIVAPFVVPAVFGAAFEPAVVMTCLLVLANGFVAGNSMFAAALAASGRPGLASIAHGTGLALTAALCPILIPRYGASGAALASIIAYGSVFGVLLWQVRHVLHLGTRTVAWPTRVDVRSACTELRLRLRR